MVGHGADPDDRPGPIAGGQHAAREGGRGDAEVPGRFVETERQATPAWPGEIDLHDDRHRPGEPLARAEEDIGEDNHAPRACEADQQRDRQREQPACNKDSPSTEPAGDCAGRLIDVTGTKGLRGGGAVVSDRHANYILNTGGATARDVRVQRSGTKTLTLDDGAGGAITVAVTGKITSTATVTKKRFLSTTRFASSTRRS